MKAKHFKSMGVRQWAFGFHGYINKEILFTQLPLLRFVLINHK